MPVILQETPEKFLDEVRKQNAQNSKNHFGIPILCSAIHKFRSVYLVEELLKDGALANAFTCVIGWKLNKSTRDRYGLWGDYSAIHLAVALGQCQVVRLLMEYGADLKSKTSKGVKCLEFILNSHLRCYKTTEDDDLELVKLLQKNGVDLNGKDNILWSTILHRAIITGSHKILRYLISIGFNVNCVDKTGKRPLHHCTWNDIESARILLENNADPNAQDEMGNTLYHCVFDKCEYIRHQHCLPDFLRLLHEFNADPNIQNNRGKTALHECFFNFEDITVSDWIANEMVGVMLVEGADPNIKDMFERTPAYWLLRNKRVPLSRWTWSLLNQLVHFGTRFDCLDIEGTSLLHVLVNRLLFDSDSFDVKMCGEILHPRFIVDLNVQDYYNRTVLHLISAKGNWDLAEVFLRHGINVDVLDCDGNTALDVAILCKRWEFVRKLLLWPPTVGQPSSSTALDPWTASSDNTEYDARFDNSECLSLLLRSLTLVNPDNKKDNNYSDDDKNNNNKYNNNTNSNTNDNNITIINSNNNSDNTNTTICTNNNICNDSLHCHNQNRKNSRIRIKLQRRNSMPSLKRGEKTNVIPLGSSVKWTKDMLEKITELVRMEHKVFYSAASLNDPSPWDIHFSPMPNISEKFLTEINRSSLRHLCEKNSLEFHVTEPCQEEHCLLAKQVFSLVNDLVTKLSEIDPRLKSELHWVGSSSEGTKMWFPDEFDFFMELTELQHSPCFITKFDSER